MGQRGRWEREKRALTLDVAGEGDLENELLVRVGLEPLLCATAVFKDQHDGF